MSSSSSDARKKQNKQKKETLKARKTQAYRTKQGIAQDEDEVDIAPIWRRVLQFGIDQALLGLFAMFFYLSFTAIFDVQVLPPILAVAPQLVFGLGYIFPSVFLSGQTFGMKKMKIIVLNKDGERLLSKKQSLIRWFILYAIPNSFFVLQPTGNPIQDQIYVAILTLFATAVVAVPVIITKERKGLHDLLSGSIMIRLPEKQPSV